MICAHEQMYTKQNKQRFYQGIEHAGHMSKSGWSVRPYSTSGILFMLFIKKNVKDSKNKQYFTCLPNTCLGYSTR